MDFLLLLVNIAGIVIGILLFLAIALLPFFVWGIYNRTYQIEKQARKTNDLLIELITIFKNADIKR